MATLIEEELARRDSRPDALAAPAPRAGTRSTYMAPADRLRAAEIDRRAAKDDGDMAVRESILAQKASAAEATANRLREDSLRRGEYQDNRMKLQEEAARYEAARVRLAEQEQLTKLATSTDIMEQATNFVRDARGMDPSKPEFDQQLQNLLAGYPRALEHPSGKQWWDAHTEKRKMYVADEIARKAVKPPGVRDFGTETVKSGDVTVQRPLGSPEEQAARDLREHAQLEKLLNTNPPKEEKAAIIGKLNLLKSRLDFDLMDATTGAVIPNSGRGPKVAPAAAPAGSTPAVAAATAAADVAAAKQLDVDAARALVQEAGGDKEKARALARERGYKF